MAKVIFEIIDSCISCPNIKYDSNYDINHKSGYNCSLCGNKRIVDDIDIDMDDWDKKIPEWCSLENKEEHRTKLLEEIK